nr:hypothetical protein [Nitrospinaceae bacterium]
MKLRTTARVYAVILAFLLVPAAGAQTRYADPPPLLDHVVKTLEGEDRHLAAYHGSPTLVVNVASRCGLTRQYAGLQSLYEKYGPQGLSILAFPCNDFRGQEPGTPQEIAAFCETHFGITFDLMEKIHVAPENRHPFYAQLIRESGNPADIRWNFEKFLLSSDGTVAARFAPKTSPDSPALISAIE